MNERLEKEIENQIYDIFFDLDGVAIAGTSEYATVEDVAYIARYFYNLALEDVDKFVESLTMNAHEMPENHPDKKYCTGIDDTVQRIFNFIDDLKE